MAQINKVVMLYLGISLLFYATGFKVIENEDFLERFLDIDPSTGNVLGASNQLENTLPTSFEDSGLNLPGFNLIDSIGAIVSFLSFIINIVFAPLGMFISASFHPLITIMIGLPLTINGIIAIMSFIRSGA